MPTTRSLLASGITEREINKTASKYVCYVCGEPVASVAQRDEARMQAVEVDGEVLPPAPADTELGHRHPRYPYSSLGRSSGLVRSVRSQSGTVTRADVECL